MSDELALWDRQKGEGARAYALFCLYRDAGADRSLRALADITGTKLGQIGAWSKKWAWVERVEGYDRHMAAIQQTEREKAEAVEAKKWAERRAEQREREWQQAEALIGRASQMLDHPLTFTRSEDGKTLVFPAKWMVRDIPTFLDLASKLARLASEMETDRKTHDIPDATSALDRLTRELARLSARTAEAADVGGADEAGSGSPDL